MIDDRVTLDVREVDQGAGEHLGYGNAHACCVQDQANAGMQLTPVGDPYHVGHDGQIGRSQFVPFQGPAFPTIEVIAPG